jgi:hypothetical protein
MKAIVDVVRILRVADKYQFLPRKFRRSFGEVPRQSSGKAKRSHLSIAIVRRGL